MKNFCSSGETSRRMKTQAMDSDKIFVKYIYDKWLISRIYKEASKFINKKVNNPIKKLGKRCNTSPKKNIIPNKHMKRHST